MTKIGKHRPCKTVKQTPRSVIRKALNELKGFLHKEDWEYYDRKLKNQKK